MKRVALGLALVVLGGILGAAFFNFAVPIFKPQFPSTLGVAPSEATNMSRATTSSAPVTVDPGPAPVPFTPPQPQVASVPDEPSPTVAQTPPAPRTQAKPAIEHATEQEVRSLSDGHCGGRTIKSITVPPDGSVHVQC
jgi:hypothetical protein